MRSERTQRISFRNGGISYNDPQFLEGRQPESMENLIDNITKYGSYDKNNKDLRESLCQFDDILKNHYWSKSHQEEINKWFSRTEGSQATVFAKMMNANIEVMKTQLKAEDKIQRLHQSSRTSVSR